MPLLLFLAGLVLLVLGAELLVRGASRLAMVIGLSPLVIGLTVVAYGTSTPELVVSVQAAWAGSTGIAVGNVVGSNILNVLFILGLAALILPLRVAQRLVWWDVPIMIGTGLLLAAMAADGRVSRLEGLLLVAGMAAYTAWVVRLSWRETRQVEAEYDEAFGDARRTPGWASALVALVGLALLVAGARWLVDAAVTIARGAGLGETVVGLTIVAAGTSLPEVATSLVAAARGERDIAVGNVVGSNIFNVLAVLGAAALVAADGVAVSPAIYRFDLPVMLAVSLACLPIFFTGHTIARWEGAVFLAYYLAYTAYLILDATGHDALPAFAGVMMAFVAPLTALTLLVVAGREILARRRAPEPA
jgi:cation:H+ antiporter